jgi:integrase
MSLTVKGMRRLIAPGRYLDDRGLYLQVWSPTNRSWLLRYSLRGKERWLGLGSAATFSLVEARERARKARQQLADGVDPLETRQAEAARTRTFRQVAEEYFKAKSGPWSLKTRRGFLQRMKHAYATLGGQSVASIDVPMVVSCLEREELWTKKTETARKVMQYIARILDYATVSGYRTGDNPATWQGRLEHRLPAPSALTKTQHLPALDYKEMGAFMIELRAVKGIPARALEFAVLTAGRAREVYEARWDEIDMDAALWTVPEQRQKSRRTHEVPLSRQAVALLKGLPREAEFVFIGSKVGRPISNSAMLETLKALRPTVSCHGFRSSFRTWSAERSNFDRDVIEESLAHRVGSSTERAYRRTTLLELRAKLMQAWADYCDGATAAEEQVLPFVRHSA